MLRKYPLIITLLLAILFAALIPADEKLPDLQDSRMYVPWKDFKGLLEKLLSADKPVDEPKPPVGYTVTADRMTGEVDGDGDSVSIDFEMELSVLEKSKWVEVPLFTGITALEDVKLNGGKAPVNRNYNNSSLIIKGSGDYSITGRFFLPLTLTQGRTVLNLGGLNPAAVSTLQLVIPKENIDVEVVGGVLASKSERRGGTEIKAALYGTGASSVTWYRSLEREEVSEARTYSEVNTLISVGESVFQCTSVIDLTIHHAGISDFGIRFSNDISILEVSGEGIADWKVTEKGGAKILEVELSFLAENHYSLAVQYEKALADTTAVGTLPELTVLNTVREKGFIGIAAATNVEISPEGKLKNLGVIDVSELPSSIIRRASGSVLYAFKYLKHPYSASLSVKKHEDLPVKPTIIEEYKLTTFFTEDGKSLNRADFKIKNNQKQYLSVNLPGESVVWGTYLSGKPVKAAVGDEGEVLLPLEKSGSGEEAEEFSAEIVYLRNMKNFRLFGKHVLTSPVADVDIMDARWEIYVPDGYRYYGFDGTMKPIKERMQTLETAHDKVQTAPGKAGYENERRMAEEKAKRIVQQDASMARPLPSQAPPMARQMEVFQLEGGRTKGVLPIKISIPAVGKRYRFEERLITAGESPSVSFRFIHSRLRLPGVLTFVSFIAAFFLTGFVISTLRTQKLWGISLWRALSALAIAAALALTVLVIDVVRTGTVAGIMFMLLGYVVYAALISSGKKESE